MADFLSEHVAALYRKGDTLAASGLVRSSHAAYRQGRALADRARYALRAKKADPKVSGRIGAGRRWEAERNRDRWRREWDAITGGVR